jgi:hypothetical protein
VLEERRCLRRSSSIQETAFAHKKGKGFTLLIGGKRYTAFPPAAASSAMRAATRDTSGAPFENLSNMNSRW